jgi:hypothetical protein
MFIFFLEIFSHQYIPPRPQRPGNKFLLDHKARKHIATLAICLFNGSFSPLFLSLSLWFIFSPTPSLFFFFLPSSSLSLPLSSSPIRHHLTQKKFSLFFVSKVLVLSSLSLLLTFTETFVSENLGSTLSEILYIGNSQRHLERKLLKVSEKFFNKFWFNGLTKMMGLGKFWFKGLMKMMGFMKFWFKRLESDFGDDQPCRQICTEGSAGSPCIERFRILI